MDNFYTCCKKLNQESYTIKGGGVNLIPNFQKGGLDKIVILRGVWWEREE